MKANKQPQDEINMILEETDFLETTDVSQVLIGTEVRARGQYPSPQMAKDFYLQEENA
ncbi:hypothetical protein AAFN85_13385 [Mucilaginibacter sp. CAU 1740]|uniref:hypothetical protein n=1 Tax=Mucilaginibacter sp. CAU 1740 TaxID=3140365 RepID=UPI00325C07A5